MSYYCLSLFKAWNDHLNDVGPCNVKNLILLGTFNTTIKGNL